MATKRLVEGWTEPILYNLFRDGAAWNATGMLIALAAVDTRGVSLTVSGTTDWASASQSQARFTPDATDLKASRSPILVRFKVTDGVKVSYYPQDEPLHWVIDKQPA